MIIPIKCFSCGNLLANKYKYFREQTNHRKKQTNTDPSRVEYLSKTRNEKTAEGTVLDEMKLTNLCCRRQMLCHVDIL